MYSWQSFRYRGELIGLKWPREIVRPGSIIDRDRLDPMDGILEDEQIAQAEDELMGQQRI